MDILITGGSGFLGKKLAAKLLERGRISIAGGETARIHRIHLFDLVAPEGLPDDDRLVSTTGDITDAGMVRQLVTPAIGAVFHLAAIVSADAEENFDLGMGVNFDGTRNVLEACRHQGHQPGLVFASSVAVYGGDLPEVGNDSLMLTPTTSYGAQKAMAELLVNDYDRKGFIEGRAIRLPTIVVRPGKPNKAASTFASSIIREPLAGQSVRCPVSPESKMFFLSPRKVIDAFIKTMEMPSDRLGVVKRFTLPGISAGIGEVAAALEEVAGKQTADLIQWQQDPYIQRIVSGWMADFQASRALSLGYEADANIQEIIRAHIEDELSS